MSGLHHKSRQHKWSIVAFPSVFIIHYSSFIHITNKSCDWWVCPQHPSGHWISWPCMWAPRGRRFSLSFWTQPSWRSVCRPESCGGSHNVARICSLVTIWLIGTQTIMHWFHYQLDVDDTRNKRGRNMEMPKTDSNNENNVMNLLPS